MGGGGGIIYAGAHHAKEMFELGEREREGERMHYAAKSSQQKTSAFEMQDCLKFGSFSHKVSCW